MVAMRESKVPRGRDRGHHNSPMRDDLAVRVKGGATEALHSVRQGVRSAAKQVRQTASEVTGALRTTLHEEADELYQRHKGTATSQVKRFGKIAEQTAHALHAVKADKVAEYLDQASQRMEEAADYLKESDLAQLMHDTGRVVRRNRGLAMGGMFIAGYALARFLKATRARDQREDDRQDEQADRGHNAGGSSRNGTRPGGRRGR